MIVDSIAFRGHRCFKNDWAGFDTVKPINVIIGRNNTGKSHLLDLVEAICSQKLNGRGWRYRCRGRLDQTSLQSVFKQNHNGGGNLQGNHWAHNGCHFDGVLMTWEVNEDGSPADLFFPPEFDPTSPDGDRYTQGRFALLREVVKQFEHRLVVPKIENKSRSEFTFAFEELENNLHPALLRRLFQFLEKYAVDENSTIFLTTHSSVL